MKEIEVNISVTYFKSVTVWVSDNASVFDIYEAAHAEAKKCWPGADEMEITDHNETGDHEPDGRRSESLSEWERNPSLR